MPVRKCNRGGKPGYKWGSSGRCYTYTEENEQSRKRAKRKAFLQGAAIQASGAKEMTEPSKLKEFDNSLNDYIDLVRREFEKMFGMDGSGEFAWVADVFEDHLVARQGDQYFEVMFEQGDDSIEFSPRDEWTAVKLSYVQEMIKGQFRDIVMISEFKGTYPDITIFDDVDIKELTVGDPSPVFVTLPIGLAGATSGNKRHYDDPFVQELEKQVKSMKPVGLMGHLDESRRAYDFPAEAVHWIGTKRVNELLWGKGYVPPGEPRTRLQRYKATNKKIATSIDAQADGIWDPNLGAYRMIAETLKLGQIDIAPADRAGIGDLSAIPILTQEMLQDPSDNSKEKKMEREDVIKSLTAEEIPDNLKNTVVSQQVQEYRQALGLSEDANVIEEIKKLREALKSQERRAVTDKITELSTSEEKGIKPEAIRNLVVEIVTGHNPETAEEAQRIYEQVIERETVKAALASHVQETMGPNQQAPVQGQHNGSSGKFFVIPEDDKENE